MEHDFYWISGSPNSWRAMLALEHKGVAYKSHRLDPSKREQKDAAFLVLNPLGTVPALKLGGTVITESIAIMAYLERAFPASPLFGESALETGLIWQRIFEFVNGLRNLIDEGVIRPLSHGTKGDGSAVLKVSAKAVRAALAKLEAFCKLRTTSRLPRGQPCCSCGSHGGTQSSDASSIGQQPERIGTGSGVRRGAVLPPLPSPNGSRALR